jgi:hypothetical protein
VELEGISRVSVSGIFLQIGWQVDDVDGAEGTLFRTDTTAYA